MEGQGEVLWSPPPDVREATKMGRFLAWVEQRHGVTFKSYDDAWRWSVEDVGRFWESLAEHCEVKFHSPPAAILEGSMPNSRWFRDATLNYAEHALDGDPDVEVLTSLSEARGATVRLTRGELRERVAAVRTGLRRLGVGPGDRVAAYLPNIPEAFIGLLATASLGAVWTSCPPEFGVRSVVDRLAQVEPKVLLAVAGYRFGGRDFDRSAELAEVRAALPTVEATVWLPYLDLSGGAPGDTVPWDAVEDHAQSEQLAFDPVPFDHPLYILYSSGTTGKPKAIVHGHGGILLEHLKWLGLHDDIGESDRYFWYSSTGWMAWNLSVSSLMCGASLLTLDGALGHPDLASFWRMLSEHRITWLGTSPAFLLMARNQGTVPSEIADLSAVRTVMSGGAPLPAEGFHWVYESLNPDLYLCSGSGGTDVGGAFVAGTRLLPVWAGEIACRLLGCDVHAFDEQGREVVGRQGELVVLQPMPSMPLRFWGDDHGERLRSAYFDRFPGIWCHGDWITFTERGSAIVHGRSDATLNRGGVRLGTSEFYALIDDIDGVRDSLIVHLEDPAGGLGELILFVQLEASVELDDGLQKRICEELRKELSPRHIPDRIVQVPAVPRTSTGKRMEVPVKRILCGSSAGDVASKDSMADPEALTPFEAMARKSASR